MASPVDEKYRVLSVTVKSAELNTKLSNAKTYVSVYMNPEGRLSTKKKNITNNNNNNNNSNPTWNDRFVFSISDHSLHNIGTSVCFEVHSERRVLGFGDSLIGVATCDVKSLLDGFDKYDDSDNMEVFEDPRYPNMFACDDNIGNGRSKIVKGPGPKASACLEIVKQGRKEIIKKGVLKVELEVGETISCLGRLQWKNMAMPYEEFMGDIQPSKANKIKKKKFSSWVCFVSTSKYRN